MDGRISRWLLTIPLAALCGGCITQRNTTTSTPDSVSHVKGEESPKAAKKDDAPKRMPQPATVVGIGKLKEADADSEDGKKNPELQARLRDDARQAYLFALKLEPNNLEAQRCLGKLYAKLGDYDRAFDVLKKAIDKNPKDANLWFDMGTCYHFRKDFTESIRCFTKAVEIDPYNRDSMKMLGLSLAWIGQVDKGISYLTRAQGPALAHFNIACMYDQ